MAIAPNDIQSKFLMTLRDLGLPSGEFAVQVVMQGIRSTILPFIDADVNHGMTDIAQTDTFYNILIENSGSGGVELLGLSEAETGVNIRGISTTTDITTAVTSSGAVRFTSSKKDGTTDQKLANNENAFIFKNRNDAIAIMKGNGDFLSDGTFTSNGFDFAEFLPSESAIKLGVPVGINENGFAEEYKTGDKLIGVSSENPAFLANAENTENMSIVGLVGQFDLDESNIVIEGIDVLTSDKKYIIGIKLANGKTLLGIEKV